MARGFYTTTSAAPLGLPKKTRQLLLALVFLTLAAFILPFGEVFGYPFVLMSTFAHEMGHGLAALLIGENFVSLQMFSDGSGVATIAGFTSPIGAATAAGGGLLGPSIFAALCFIAAKKGAIARIFLSAAGVGMIVAEFLYIRNTFAWVFVAVLATLFLWLAQQSRPWVAQASLIFLGIQLSLSVFSRSDYLFAETALTSQGVMPSDVAVIAEAMSMPVWLCGAICALYSIIILSLGLWAYIRK